MLSLDVDLEGRHQVVGVGAAGQVVLAGTMVVEVSLIKRSEVGI
jgi:hypothetical protein